METLLSAQFFCESQTALKNKVFFFFFSQRQENHVDQNFGKKYLRRERGPSEKEGKEGLFFFFLSSGSSLSRGKAGHKTQGNILKWMDPLDPPHGNGKD